MDYNVLLGKIFRSTSNLSNKEIRKHEECFKFDKEPFKLESVREGISIFLFSSRFL